MRLVILESPYAGDVERNLRYARACVCDSLLRGEAPIASHLLYTQILQDAVPAERAHGINAGLAWGRVAEASVFYVDRGISFGMALGMRRAEAEGRVCELREIGLEWEAKYEEELRSRRRAKSFRTLRAILLLATALAGLAILCRWTCARVDGLNALLCGSQHCE